jgi:predicted phage tail protein
MCVLRFENNQDAFEMAVSSEEDASLQSFGDAYVAVKVQSHGFTGHNDLSVLGSAMREFCQQLCQLNKTLKGEASLSGISPGEVQIKVRSVSSFGHVAVEGTTGYRVQGRHSSYFHAVTFGFEFDQEQLVAAAELPWVQRYANGHNG